MCFVNLLYVITELRLFIPVKVCLQVIAFVAAAYREVCTQSQSKRHCLETQYINPSVSDVEVVQCTERT